MWKWNETQWLPRYAATRLAGPATLLLPLLLVGLGRASACGPLRLPWGLDWLLTAWLTAAFRLADDLADREHDQQRHPQRVLCRAPALWPFGAALVLAATVGGWGVGLTKGPIAMLLLLVAMGGAGAWYAARGRMGRPAIWNYHLILLKYPVMTLIVGDPPGWPVCGSAWRAAGIAYLGMCVFEVAHDADLRSRGASRRLAAVEFAILIGLAVWGMVQSGD